MRHRALISPNLTNSYCLTARTNDSESEIRDLEPNSFLRDGVVQK